MSPGVVTMEDVKPLISSSNMQIEDGGALECRFVEICKSGLSLDEKLTKEAMGLLNESKQLLLANMSAIGSGTPEEIERLWFACILYTILRNLYGADWQKRLEGKESQANALEISKQAQCIM